MWCGARNGRVEDQRSGVQPGDAVDPRHLDRLGPGELGQDRRQPARQHRLAGPGRALHQQVVAAGGGDLERQQRCRVSADVGQVGQPDGGPRGVWRSGSAGGSAPLRTAAAARRSATATISKPVTSAASRARWRGTISRRHPARRAPSATASAPGESRSSPPSDSSPKTAYSCSASRGTWPLDASTAERERRVEARAGLAQRRRREVGGDPRGRELEARVQDRRPDPVARLAHGRVAEADDRERGQPGADVDLDPHLARVAPRRSRTSGPERASAQATDESATVWVTEVPIVCRSARRLARNRHGRHPRVTRR